MSLSTSNSNNMRPDADQIGQPGGWRLELKVLLVVAIVVLGVEFGLRAVGNRLSRNERHIAEFPALSKEATTAARPRILLLGNSLVRLGIDEAVLKEDLAKQGVAVGSVTKMVPDMSTSLDWYAAYRTYFTAEQHPDIVIVSSFAHHYNDGEPVDARVLGWHFSCWADVPELFRCDIRGFGDRAEFLLSHVSAIYGMRKEVLHVMEKIIPNYVQGAYRVNESARALAATRAAGRTVTPPKPTYNRLSRFMALLRQQHVSAIFVAMPPDTKWDPQLPDAVKAGGMEFLDCREVPGIMPGHFSDGYHLSPEGARIFTRYLCQRLVELSPLRHPATQ
jgi:hypothetical protein